MSVQNSEADNCCDQTSSDLKLVCALTRRSAFTAMCCSVTSARHMLPADFNHDKQACPHHLLTHQCDNKEASKKRTVGHFMDLNIFLSISLTACQLGRSQRE